MPRLLLLIHLILCLNVFGQNEVVLDSLRGRVEELSDGYDKANAILDLAWVYKDSDPEITQKHANEALLMAQEWKARKVEARAYNVLGVAFENLGDYDAAMEHYFSAMEIDEELGNEVGVASCLNNIGGVYYYKKEPDKAIDYFKQALVINREIGDQNRIAGNINNIASMLHFKQSFTEAIPYYKEAFKIYKELGQEAGMAFCFNNLASAHSNLGNHERSLAFYDSSWVLNEALGRKRQLSALLVNLGVLRHRMGEPEAAEELFFRAIDSCVAIGALENLKEAYVRVAEFYAKEKRFEEALKYQLLAEEAKDSLIDLATVQQITNLEEKYKSRQREQEIAYLKKKEEVSQLELAQEKADAERERVINYSIIGAALFLLVLLYLLYKRYQLRQKQAILDRINQHQEELLNAVVEAQEDERQRIARELHDGLGSLLSTVRINLDTVKHGPEEQVDLLSSSIEMVDEVCQDLRLISHNLMPGALVRSGLGSALKEFGERVSTSGIVVDVEVVGVEERMEPIQEIILFRVTQEAVNNAIKHARPKRVHVQLVGHEDHLSLIIEDDGAGMESDTKPAGIGLSNMRSRLGFLNGTLTLDSVLGRGTSVIAEIPR